MVEEVSVVSPIQIQSAELLAVISPEEGACIKGIESLNPRVQLLWKTPYRSRPIPARGADSLHDWLSTTSGGWQIVCPNGGPDCSFEGVTHQFHGEAGRVAWDVLESSESSVEMSTDLFFTPLRLTRRITIIESTLEVFTQIENVSPVDVSLMWIEHLVLGQDFLGDATRIHVDSGSVTVDDLYDEPSNKLSPGAVGAWPTIAGKNEIIDLQTPLYNGSGLSYLHEMEIPQVTVNNPQVGLSVSIQWSEIFSGAWLWQEIEGSTSSPWFGRTRALGIEPATSRPSQGIFEVSRKTGTQLVLGGHESVTGGVTFTISKL